MHTDPRYNQNYGAVQNDPYHQQNYGYGQQQPYLAGYYQQPGAEEAVTLELERQTAKELNILGFNNKVIRAAFIRKVTNKHFFVLSIHFMFHCAYFTIGIVFLRFLVYYRACWLSFSAW